MINAENYTPKHLLTVDSIESRLDLAKSLGAEPWNFQTDREGLDQRVKELTDGRGVDVIIGMPLQFAFPDNSDSLRRGGWHEPGIENGL